MSAANMRAKKTLLYFDGEGVGNCTWNAEKVSRDRDHLLDRLRYCFLGFLRLFAFTLFTVFRDVRVYVKVPSQEVNEAILEAFKDKLKND